MFNMSTIGNIKSKNIIIIKCILIPKFKVYNTEEFKLNMVKIKNNKFDYYIYVLLSKEEEKEC